MPGMSKLLIPVLGFAALSSSASGAALSVRLIPSMPSPQPVGTLIGLFSAPPCPEGSRFRVAFERQGEKSEKGLSHTALENCRGSRSGNAYVAGMLPDADYRMRAEIVNGSDVKQGNWMPFHTGLL